MRTAGLCLSAVMLTALAAACTPSTFDGLTGKKGKKIEPTFSDPDPDAKDESLRGKDPRPVAPYSGSWVNTAHPRFTWKLQDGTAGANVELSQTRDFAKPKRIVATGSETTVQGEGLTPGIWFWRLQARSDSAGGVSYGPTWTVLVRGKSKNATVENTAAHGGISDIDGDGLPELHITMTTREPLADGPNAPTDDFPVVATLFGVGTLGSPAAFDPFNVEKIFPNDAAGDAPAIAAGVDLNGDGFGDLVVGDVWTATSASAKYMGLPNGGSLVYPFYGADPSSPEEEPAEGEEDEAEGGAGGYPELYTQAFTKPPVLSTGDFNGDGYGDISGIFPDVAMTMQGGTAAFTMLPFEAPGPTPATSFLIGAGDFDGDGLSDLAYTPFDTVSPLRLAKGSAVRYRPEPNLTQGTIPAVPTRATALATGDFDGDGFDEVAFTTTVGGKAAVCVHTITSAAINAHACWITDAATAGFGVTLGAGDVDGDGVDEIFVGSTTGITILSHAGVGYADATSVFTPTPVNGPYTPYFSVFYPGRPGNAQWAVYGTDKKTLYVIDGSGADGKSTKYEFTNLKHARDIEVEFLHFGTAIR